MRRLCLLLALLLIPFAADAQEVDVGTLLKELNGRLEWNGLLKTGVLTVGGNRIVFTVNAPWIVVNSSLKIPTSGVRREHGRIVFPQATAASIKGALQGGDTLPRTYRVAAIVLDPGHGGRDSGASYRYVIDGKTVRISEKDIVLTLGKMLLGMLKKRFPNKVVLMTRDRDVTLPLEERPAVANAIPLKDDEAIIYISLHTNASLSRTARGFEVWYLTSTYRRDLVSASAVDTEYRDILPIMNSMQEEEFTRESVLLARMILSELQSAIGGETENRGMKEGEWLVVRKAKMPSILIEFGFVSHREEAIKLTSASYLQKLSGAVYNGVSAFIGSFERSKAFTE
ncbi:MAG: N-acetylmuramoyl-L-alanine amidase [Spirochaetales bacterium]|nr:N-acetylmuramoyl-L-alanine amidase [Spirochaetales bacterium]